jgi:hypothetical protein
MNVGHPCLTEVACRSCAGSFAGLCAFHVVQALATMEYVLQLEVAEKKEALERLRAQVGR